MVRCSLVPRGEVSAASVAEAERARQDFIHAWQTKNLNAAVATFAPDAVAVDPVPPGRFAEMEAICAWIVGDFGVLENMTITTSDLQIKASRLGWIHQPNNTHHVDPFKPICSLRLGW